MSNARSHRRRVRRESHYGQVKVYPSGTRIDRMTSCQHCGRPGLGLVDTYAELVQVAELHGMRVGPIDAFGPLVIQAYWFCHNCGEGGPIIAA
jgi:hypothetical protein